MVLRRSWLWLSVLILSGLSVSLSAQDRKPVRMEIPVKDDSEIYKVVPCGESGCAIFFLSNENSKDGQMIWKSAILNKKLMEYRRYSFELPKGFILEDALYKKGRLLAFFYTTRNSADTNFYLVDINFADSSLFQHSYPVPGRSGMSHFAMSDKYAIAGINVRNDQSMMLKYDLNNHQISLLSTGIKGKTMIESAGINELTGGFSTVLRTNQSLKKRSYYLVKFNTNGQPYFTHMFSKFEDLLINTAYTYAIDRQSDIIIGSYGTSSRTHSIDGVEMAGIASTGFFSIVINEQGDEIVNTYDFSEFDRFYRYLRRSTEISPRTTLLRRDRSIRDISADYNLLSHEIFKQNGEYIFMAEAYYPEFRTVTTMVYDYYGRPYPSTYSVFEGYRYLTTFIAGFDSKGELKWNNDLELTDALTYSLRERVTPFPDSANLMLCYVEGDRIAYKLIDKGQNLSNVSFSKIDPLHRQDKVQKESNSYIVPWYKDYFLVHGYQTIRNASSAERAKSVFYLSKMAFQE